VGIYLDCLSNLKSPSCSASASTADKNAALATYGQAASACATSSSIGSLSSACQKALSAAVTTDNSVTLP